MPNTTSASLKLTVQATGENSGTWGQFTNTNLLILEQAIGGYDSVALNATTGATLTFTNGALSNGKNKVIKLTGTITANVNVVIPDSIEKTYVVENATSGAFTVTVKTSSGTGVTWAATDKGKKLIYSDGTNILEGISSIDTLKVSTLTSTGIDDNATSTAITIDSSDNVGIGTASPSNLLHIQGNSTTGKVYIQSTSIGPTSFDGSGAGLLLTAGGMNGTNKFTPAIQFGSTDPNFTTTNPKVGAAINAICAEPFGADTDGGMHLAFYTTPDNPGTGQTTTERMIIRSSGNVGINTSSPTEKLHIADGTVRISKTTDPRLELDCDLGSGGSQVALQEGGFDRANYEWDGTFLKLGTTANGFDWFIRHNGSNCATVSSSGVTNTSDARVKSNIRDADVGLDEILNLSAKLFERNSSPDITELGLIAQDIESAGIPHTIIERGHSGEEIKSVNPMGLIATLVNAVKELKTKNDSLEARITALENA